MKGRIINKKVKIIKVIIVVCLNWQLATRLAARRGGERKQAPRLGLAFQKAKILLFEKQKPKVEKQKGKSKIQLGDFLAHPFNSLLLSESLV